MLPRSNPEETIVVLAVDSGVEFILIVELAITSCSEAKDDIDLLDLSDIWEAAVD